ncbi:uncharacterized protein MJAP1_001461 [Malassezia japonica]|uniref:Uncharacterized protein n=1 Tax=Malassezia japonica TaxID=223818 RepID=A0AAF0EWM8_9BASI|nr:uncharacterized protein MJAP1_001461 [Malassezia japonica]WFD38508.1 hypothetical protein MJAP1_001461 [Malassezia japonica]
MVPRSAMRGVRAYSQAPPRLVGAQPTIRGPMRPFTSGVLGFLLGFSAAGVAGLYWLQREYRSASNSVLASSARLTDSATNVTGYLDRLNLLEARMREVSGDAMSRTEANTAAESLRKLYADLFEETHELRERMWELEHETFATRKRQDPPSWAPPLKDTVRLPPVRLV